MFLIKLFCCASIVLAITPRLRAEPTTRSNQASPDAQFVIDRQLQADDFDHGMDNWVIEAERGGTVEAVHGQLNIDVPAGCTIWFKSQITEPVLIEYEARMVSAGGTNDRVSDLNSFWMASDARSPGNIFDTKRSGKFSDYNQLLTYYVGQGGNNNTTTRFRRYIGEQENRPLLPEHDLRDSADLLAPNALQKIQLITSGSTIEYFRDAKCIFNFNDPKPYTSGWFAFRTTKNHMTVEHFRVYRLSAAATTQPSK
jgi:Domain of unknown function (DUF6250)